MRSGEKSCKKFGKCKLLTESVYNCSVNCKNYKWNKKLNAITYPSSEERANELVGMGMNKKHFFGAYQKRQTRKRKHARYLERKRKICEGNRTANRRQHESV